MPALETALSDVIAAATSDSIIALRMTDGKMMWHHQEFAGDAFMARCQATNPADSNCAGETGSRL